MLVALVSCVDGSLLGGDDPGTGSVGSGGAGSVGAGGALSGQGGATGTASGVGGATTGAGGATTGTGGATGVGGGTTTGTGGATTGSGGTAGAGGSPPVCTDNQHPDHLDKPCSIWAEWDLDPTVNPKNCGSEWLTGAGYCLESCGECSNGSGGSSSGGSGSTGSGGTNPGPDLPNITNGTVYWASRYWDCCKPHCANQGMPSCAANGTSPDSGGSACVGGSAYACYNEAPRAVGTEVSYGYVAVPNPSCGTCYHIQFTGTGQHNQADPGSQLIRDKHMIVKVTNTGGDVAGNQFDLMIPGGGVGINPNTCPSQWGVSGSDLGPASGGFLSACSGSHAQKKECVRQKCQMLPAGDLRDGCIWFVDWYQIADNPQFRYEPISCPNDL